MATNLRAHVLIGATGSGKSALAMRWAEATGNSIISCDSMQVYRGLDIGTAKPSQAEQQAVPHALIDVVDLPAVYSAADWARAATCCIQQENAAGRIPLICGGTGFYLRALLQGFSDIPDIPAAIRQELETRLQEEGREALHAELQTVDPTISQRIGVTDTQRLLRALGIWKATARPLSSWQAQPATGVQLQGKRMWLQKPRQQLRQDIAERFMQMIDAGWLNEVRWLQAQQIPQQHPAMRAVGYRQLLQHVQGECSLETAIEQGITATRRYAKRQNTWFRHQLSCDMSGNAAEVETYLWN